MIGRGYGKIINIASDAGRMGTTGQVVYAASKAGVIGFTKSLAMEIARYKINVNCICPGFVDTPLLNQASEEAPKLQAAYLKLIPWKRMGQPDELAAALFLASDNAQYITGQTLSVNGGLTMA